MTQCTAKAKSTGNRCRRSAVTGYKVCQVHGAGSVKKGRAGGAPIQHGRYSLKHRQSLAQKQEEFLSDPNPGDLTAELALMRALLQDYLERYTDDVKMPAMEIERIIGMAETISKLVERISKILNQTALTQAELLLLQNAFVNVLNEFIEDDNKRIAAVDRLQSYIQLPQRISSAN